MIIIQSSKEPSIVSVQSLIIIDDACLELTCFFINCFIYRQTLHTPEVRLIL